MVNLLEWSVGTYIEAKIDMSEIRLRVFMENEARSCPMDFACVTSKYVFRSWDGLALLREIMASMHVVNLPM